MALGKNLIRQQIATKLMYVIPDISSQRNHINIYREFVRFMLILIWSDTFIESHISHTKSSCVVELDNKHDKIMLSLPWNLSGI